MHAAGSLHDFELRRLDSTERESLRRYAGQPLLLMLFEPECPWCLRQSRAIDALREHCPGIEAAVIGMNGQRRDLRDSLRRFRVHIDAYQASGALLSALGGVDGTPFTLISDARGQPLGWLQGYIPEQRLRDAVNDLTGNVCEEKAGPA